MKITVQLQNLRTSKTSQTEFLDAIVTTKTIFGKTNTKTVVLFKNSMFWRKLSDGIILKTNHILTKEDKIIERAIYKQQQEHWLIHINEQMETSRKEAELELKKLES